MPYAKPVSLTLPNFLTLTLIYSIGGGLLEAAARFVLPLSGLAGAPGKACVDESGIVWAAPLVQFTAMLAIGVVVWLASGVLRRGQPAALLGAVFTFLAAWSALTPVAVLHARAILVLALGVAAISWRGNLGGWVATPGRNRWILGTSVACLAGFLLMSRTAATAQARSGGAAKPGQPSVLLIVLDTLRADRLGVYGYPRGTSPFLDEYARSSVVYEQAIAASSWTLPSHVSLFTGRRAMEHGAVLDSFDGRFESLAETLAKSGYETAGFSGNTSYVVCRNGVASGFDHFESSFITWSEAVLRTSLGHKLENVMQRVEGRKQRYPSAQEVRERFEKWLDERQRGPFFAFINLMDTHYPYVNDPQFAQRFPGAKNPPTLAEWTALIASPKPPSAELKQRVQDTYDAAVAYQDSQLRELFAGLKSRKLDENLLVVITADHGEALGEHHLFDHRHSLYRELIHVPLILHFSGRVPAGVRIRETVALRQVPSTLASLAGLQTSNFPGPTLPLRPEEAEAAPPRAVRSHLAGGKFPGVFEHWPIYQGWVRSVVYGSLHLIVQEDGKMELYDWASDPAEEHNLIAKADSKVVGKLLAEMRRGNRASAEESSEKTPGTVSTGGDKH